MPPLSSEHSLLLSRSVGGVCAGDVASRARGGRFLMMHTGVKFRLGFRLESGGRAKSPDFLLLHPLHHSPRQQPRKQRLQDTHNSKDCRILTTPLIQQAMQSFLPKVLQHLATSYNKKLTANKTKANHTEPTEVKKLRLKPLPSLSQAEPTRTQNLLLQKVL